MPQHSTTGTEDLKERLGRLLAVTDSEAAALLRAGPSAVDTDAIARRVGLDRAEVDRIVASRTAIENARINANKVTMLQLQRIPELTRERMRVVLDGRPYFSLHELEEATGLSGDQVADIFTVPDLGFTDKVTGKRRGFEPVFGKYVAQPRLDFESDSLVEALGFIERPAGRFAPIRVIVPSETEAPKKSYELKRALGGQVHPVVRDGEGFERYFVPASIDVWFKSGVATQRALSALAGLGLVVKDSRPKVGFYQAELAVIPADLHTAAATLSKIEEIAHNPDIAFAEPTEVGFEDFTPEREQQVAEFEDAAVGSRTWNFEAIELAQAHALTEGSEDVTVLIVDSGIRPDHQDLSGALRPDWTVLDLNFDIDVPEAELSPKELNVSHGTKVASIAGGRGPAGIGRVRGVAPGCWLLPVKISGSPFGQSYGLRAVAIREAAAYVAAGKRAVVNISWATNGEHIGIREALFEASDKGFATMASAGNYAFGEAQTPDKPHYPSRYAFLPGDTDADAQARRKVPGLASVAAVNALRKKASYSYYGAQSVSFSAPGGESGYAGTGVLVASTPMDYAYEAGTSFSAPHAAGLVALLWSAKPGLTAQEAIEVMRSTATSLDADNPGFAGMLGAGLINARAALASLGIAVPAPEEPSPPPAPTPSGSVVNINTAGVNVLTTLPYIGQWSAQVIVDYRAANGPFATIWDLTLTGAVDHWIVDQIKDLISVGPVSPSAPMPPADGQPADPSALVNINSAGREALTALPFIGEWSAGVIVDYRSAHGPFATIWDLTLTGAVDRWVVGQIQDLVTTG